MCSVVDQIKNSNDMAIEVLEDDQEKTLIYPEILERRWRKTPVKNRHGADLLYRHRFHRPGHLRSGKRCVFPKYRHGSFEAYDLLSGPG